MVRINLRTCIIISILFFAVLCPFTFGKTIYVDDDATGANDGSSWENAYVYLQDALADANSAEKLIEIHVAQGIYKPDQGLVAIPEFDWRTTTFQLINGVTLMGGFAGLGGPDPNARDVQAHETILSGDIGTGDHEWDNCYHVVTGNSTESTAVLDGFTITAGTDWRPWQESYRGKGAGMYNKSGSPTVTNCTFSRNWSAVEGGGVYNDGNSSPTFFNCTLSDNYAELSGAGMYNRDSSPILINCTFSENYVMFGGGGMLNFNSSPTLTNCIFSGNSAGWDGGGILNDDSDPNLTNCTFSENSADEGGGMYNLDSEPNLINCIFSSNSALSGGGIYNEKCKPTLTNCTFSGNTVRTISEGRTPTLVGGKGGGMYSFDSESNLNNCIFSANSALSGGGIYNEKCRPTLTNCTFSGNTVQTISERERGGGLTWIGGKGGGMYSFDSESNLNNCIFSGNSAEQGAGMCNNNSNSILTNCTFSGNIVQRISEIRREGGFTWIGGEGAGMYNCVSDTMLTNCTFALNSAQNGNAMACSSPEHENPSNIEMTNCITWDGGNEIWNEDGSTIDITYSIVKGGQSGVYDPCEAVVWGEGNIDEDPLFANLGYWADVDDPNIVVEPNDPNAVWIDGDYHLKSESGRWYRISESWVLDDVTSPCIDAGDPNSPVGDEPEHNGGIINMGAYGGTAKASMSLPDVYIQWLGHSSVKVWTDDCIVYVDPQSLSISTHDATFVCVTHTHGDHYSPSDIVGVSNAETQFIAPPDVVAQYGRGQSIAPGQTMEFDFVTVKAVPSYNTNKPNHPKSNNWVGYIIELGGKRIYVAGDTDLIEEMKSLGDINVAFLPAGGTYTMNATEAAEATEYIKPDLAIPYHWGRNVGTLRDAETFAELARCAVTILSSGETISSDNWPVYSPLIAHWALDETEGNIAHDSASEIHGTLSGDPAWQPAGGRIDGALQLDGIDDYITTDFVVDPADGAFSVFAWIKGDVPGQVVISQADGTGSGETWLGADPLLGKLMTGLVPPPAGRFAPQPLVSDSVVTDGQWHHIGFAWDGSYRALYVDGIEVKKDAAAQNPLKSADGGMYIGAGKTLDAVTFFSGLIDDVRIYNVALSAEEIEELAH